MSACIGPPQGAKREILPECWQQADRPGSDSISDPAGCDMRQDCCLEYQGGHSQRRYSCVVCAWQDSSGHRLYNAD